MTNAIGENFIPCEAVFTCTIPSEQFPSLEIEVKKKFHDFSAAEDWGVKIIDQYPNGTNKYFGITRI